jgi:hypothetical protein
MTIELRRAHRRSFLVLVVVIAAVLVVALARRHRPLPDNPELTLHER